MRLWFFWGWGRVSHHLVQIWFSYACQQMTGIAHSCLFLSDESKKSFLLAETTSEEFSQSKYVHESVQAVISRRKAVVTQQASNQKLSSSAAVAASVVDIHSKNLLVTAPLILNKQLVGIVCFEFKHTVRSKPQSQSPNYLESVESAIAWLSCIYELPSASGSKDAESALKVVAMALSQSQSSEASMAVASELAGRLQCERVSIGLFENNDVRLHTISNSTQHVTQQNLVKCIEAAMLEAIDQQETLLFPPRPNSYYSTQEHDALIRQHLGEYICTVPLVVNEVVTGAVMFERQGLAGEFNDETKESCEQLASLFAPILHYRRLNDRPIIEKLKESTSGLFANIFGHGYLGTKLITSIIAGVLVTTYFMPWDYRISANAILEGEIERVITAPEEGYLKEASVRPGDIVEAGATLATLDDRDLQLEKLKWTGKLKQVSKEYREALATHEQSQIGILRSQLGQAEAQLEILEHKLSRIVISSPISAVIVSGDFTRALGSPVERGQVLYKVSPLENYRIVLQVDESDVSEVTVGMKGELTLSAAAEETFEMEVVKITPVSTAENGINYFQVEASLASTPDFLRPGMQGIGKIEIGERQLFWVWTHKAVDWIRLKLWSWW
jgi:multidrug efflux pump subunit AcrA (membrane-fusion protein)